MEQHIGSLKSIFHMAMVVIVMIKVHMIDKKLRMLERKFVTK